jgi:hypothetical protein
MPGDPQLPRFAGAIARLREAGQSLAFGVAVPFCADVPERHARFTTALPDSAGDGFLPSRE